MWAPNNIVYLQERDHLTNHISKVGLPKAWIQLASLTPSWDCDMSHLNIQHGILTSHHCSLSPPLPSSHKLFLFLCTRRLEQFLRQRKKSWKMAAEHKLVLFVPSMLVRQTEANQHTLLTTNFSQIRNINIFPTKLFRYIRETYRMVQYIRYKSYKMCLLKYPGEKCFNLCKYTIKMATPFHIGIWRELGDTFLWGKRIKWGVPRAHISPSIRDKKQLLQ